MAAGVIFYFYRQQTVIEQVTISSINGTSEGFLTDIIKAYGIDKKNGLDIKVIKADSSEAMRLVKERKVDAGVYNPVTAAKDNLDGNRLRIFAPYRWNVTSIIVNDDSPFFKLEELRNKRLGFPGNKEGSAYINCRITFPLKDLDLETDFQTVFADKEKTLVTMLEKKETEAIVISEPLVSKLLAGEKFREISKIRFIWQEKYGLPLPCNSLAAYEDWLVKNKKLAQKLNKTFIEAANFIVSEPKIFSEQKEALENLGLTGEKEIQTFRSNAPTIYIVRWGKDVITDIEFLLATAVQFNLIPRLPDEKIIIDPFVDL